MTVGIITISDRASEGVYEDLGGPALKTAAEGYGWNVIAEAIVPDDLTRIQNSIRSFSAPITMTPIREEAQTHDENAQ